MDVIYTISLTIRRNVDACDEDATVVAEEMETQVAKSAIEREIIRALRTLDGDCDCEVMETTREKD